MKISSRRFFIIMGLGLITTVIIALFGSWFIPVLQTRFYFSPQTTPLTATYDLFDLGVVDANEDGNLDLFTLNHSARQNLLLNKGGGKFQDVLSVWQLDQDRNFPQIEDSDQIPVIDRPGIYIYRHNFELHLRTYKIDQLDSIDGVLELALPVKIQQQQLATTAIETQETLTTVKFTLKDNAWLIIKDFPEIPHSFVLSDNLPLEQIYLGFSRLNPSQHDFTMMWRDRHSMAWADFNSDGKQDVFIGRGAIRGQLDKLTSKIQDELFINQGNRYQDQYSQWGLEKKICPGRQSAWVDYDNDGKLDLYQSCGRSAEDPTPYPNQLFHQQDDGKFIDVAQEAGLDFPEAGYFYWLDADSDGDLDLLVTQEAKLQLYRNQSGKFEPQGTEQVFNSTITQLAVADFDSDGDFDVYVVTGVKTANGLLINEQGDYTFVDPTTIGIPTTGVNASWVDYDNDGLVDLHLIPNGLYRQFPNHQFEETGLLDSRIPPLETWEARCAWFDVDNNGTRDLLMSYRQTPSILQSNPSLKERIINQWQKRDTSKIWQSAFYHNIGAKNHWLEIDLVGTKGNPPAIGTTVKVITSQGTQIQQVGMSENSHYSQGHYRLYFGLGNSTKPDLIEITWANGQINTISPPSGDRILTIQQQAA